MPLQSVHHLPHHQSLGQFTSRCSLFAASPCAIRCSMQVNILTDARRTWLAGKSFASDHAQHIPPANYVEPSKEFRLGPLTFETRPC